MYNEKVWKWLKIFGWIQFNDFRGKDWFSLGVSRNLYDSRRLLGIWNILEKNYMGNKLNEKIN